jgi:DNA-binding LacI/PurR family transcriptional regulator
MARRTRQPTITDIARRVGVSVSTVSRVINGKQDVSEATRQAILDVMRESGYRTSPVARSLAGASTNLIGVYVRSMSLHFSTALISGVVDCSDRAGYGSVLFAGANCLRGYASSLLGTLPDGLLVISPGFDDVADLPFPETDSPLVLIEQLDAHPRGVVLTVTNLEGEAELTRALVEMGHRRIAYISGPERMASGRARLEGYRRAMEEAGIGVDEALVRPGGFDQQSGRAGARALLGLRDRPTAIIAANDFSAVGVLDAAREAGLRVPNDLSVAGFDDIPLAEHTTPPLTTVRQPLYEMGRKAAEVLIAWIEGSPPPTPEIVLPTQLVLRASTSAPAS